MKISAYLLLAVFVFLSLYKLVFCETTKNEIVICDNCILSYEQFPDCDDDSLYQLLDVYKDISPLRKINNRSLYYVNNNSDLTDTAVRILSTFNIIKGWTGLSDDNRSTDRYVSRIESNYRFQVGGRFCISDSVEGFLVVVNYCGEIIVGPETKAYLLAFKEKHLASIVKVFEYSYSYIGGGNLDIIRYGTCSKFHYEHREISSDVIIDDKEYVRIAEFRYDNNGHVVCITNPVF